MIDARQRFDKFELIETNKDALLIHIRNILADIKNNLVNEDDDKALSELYRSSTHLSLRESQMHTPQQ